MKENFWGEDVCTVNSHCYRKKTCPERTVQQQLQQSSDHNSLTFSLKQTSKYAGFVLILAQLQF